jgi:DNA polymerase-3 subunit alpha
VCKHNAKYYKLDDRALGFINELSYVVGGIEDSIVCDGNDYLFEVAPWEKFYQKQMDVFRNWIAEDKDTILQTLNEKIFLEDWNKYALGTISAWEMEALCFYYHDHELKDVNVGKYGFANFYALPENPVVESTFTRGGKQINIFKLSKICGTCIAKNKTKSTVSLLTTSGVVSVKFRKEYFALFDKQISAVGADGVKHVVEKSWFNRGSMIVVMGIRSGDDFISKKYASTGGHQLYKIDSIDEFGDLTLRDGRYSGEAEDSEF